MIRFDFTLPFFGPMVFCGALAGCEVVQIGDPAPPAPATTPDPGAPPFSAPTTKTQRWELANPRPVSVDLYGTWGSWLVGQAGTVLRFDGTRTTPAFTGPIDDDYRHVWASGDDDVWIAGRRGAHGHVIMHGGVAGFAVDPTIGSRPVHALFGFARADVWAAVDRGAVMHFDGTRWAERFRTSDGAPIRAIWGASARDVWLAGDGGRLVRFDGTTFTPHAIEGAPEEAAIFGVWGASAKDVWTVFDTGSRAGVAHFDGTTWALDETELWLCGQRPTTAEPEPRGRGMWGVVEGRQKLIVASRGGSCRLTFEELDDYRRWHGDLEEGTDIADLWGDSLENFFVVGHGGRLARVRGLNPGVVTTPIFPARRDQLLGVSVGTDGEVWARGNDATPLGDQLYRWTDRGWAPIVGLPSLPSHRVTAVGVRDANDAWIGAENVLLHWNGASWDRRVTLDARGTVERIVYGPDGDAWAVGNAVWRLGPETWSRIPTPRPVIATGVAVLARDDVWFSIREGARGGGALHWDGRTMSIPFSRTEGGGYWGVYAASANEVFLSGNDPMRFDGTSWKEISVPPSFDVWGTDAEHVYFGAWVRGTEAAQIVRWNGTKAEPVARHWSGHTPLAFGAWGEDAFAVGDDGLTFRFTSVTGPTR